MSANDTQVGGQHYSKHGDIQHWDMVAHFGLDYFQGQITKYVMRWRDKNGLQDLKKAAHFLQKYIELNDSKKALVEHLAPIVDIAKVEVSMGLEFGEFIITDKENFQWSMDLGEAEKLVSSLQTLIAELLTHARIPKIYCEAGIQGHFGEHVKNSACVTPRPGMGRGSPAHLPTDAGSSCLVCKKTIDAEGRCGC